MQVIDVDVEEQKGLTRIHVRVDQSQMYEKLFIGGFQNKATGQVYHHAVTQTEPGFLGKQSILKTLYSRDCQTLDLKSCGTQSLRESATQMDRPGLLENKDNDYILEAGRCLFWALAHIIMCYNLC